MPAEKITKTFYLPLRKRQLVADGTMAFWFDTGAAQFSFTPGQYTVLTLTNPPQTDAEGNTRIFSIASSPHQRDYLMIATRLRPTAFKKSLQEIPIGTVIQAALPSGQFTLPADESQPVVLIAGGIGITPFRSMLDWAAHAKTARPIWLIYSNRTLASTAFLSDLEHWAKDNRSIHLVLTLTDDAPANWKYETGKIDSAFLQKHITDLAAPVYYLAGPPQMVMALRAVLLELNIPSGQIKQELFSGYGRPRPAA